MADNVKRAKLKKTQMFYNEECKQRLMRYKDIQNFIYWIYADGINPKWVMVRNRSLVQKIILIVANELHVSVDDSFIQDKWIFDRGMRTEGPGEKFKVYDPFDHILRSPLTNQMKKERAQTESKPSLESLLLTEEQMENFPQILELGEERTPFDVYAMVEFVQTIDFDCEYEAVAIDCEMCDCEDGRECTRVSIVSLDGNVIYDTFIQPRSRVVDYLTQYSGITEEILKPVTIRLADVQRHLLKIISKRTIVVGHSLENDFWVLGLLHKRVIDTSVIYDHSWRLDSKPSLKSLSEQFLKNRFRENGEHCSIEDARCCIDLLQMKLLNGFYFGRIEVESVCQRLNKHGKTSLVIDSENSKLFPFATNFLQTDTRISSKVVESILTAKEDFVVASLQTRDKEIFESQMQNLFERLLLNSIVIVVTCGRVSDEILGREAGMSDDQLRALEARVREARKCATFVKLIN